MLFSHAKPPSCFFVGHCGLSALPICTQSAPHEYMNKQILVQLIKPASSKSKNSTNRIKGQWVAGFRVQEGHIFGHFPSLSPLEKTISWPHTTHKLSHFCALRPEWCLEVPV